MKEIKWGVLSVSGHYRLRVSDPIRHVPGMRVSAIASRDSARAGAAAAEFGIATAYGSYEDLLADKSLDAVYIPLPNHLHLEWIKKSADAGKHILCEKPLTLNADEAQEAVDYARKKGVLLMEAFMYPCHPQWIRARELIKIGEIGQVTAIQTHFCYKNTDPQNIRNRPDAGGGAILDIGCYAVSSARFLLQKEPRRVVSIVDRDPSFTTDRLTSAVVDFGDTQQTFFVGTQTFPQQTVTAFGTSGTLTVNLPFNAFPDVPLSVTVQTGIGTREIQTGPADQYGLMFQAFSDAVRSGGESPTPPEDAIANMKVLDALFASESSGGWATV